MVNHIKINYLLSEQLKDYYKENPILTLLIRKKSKENIQN